MAQAIVNPEEIRRFAARLKQFNNDLMNQLTVLHGQVSGLGQSWRDREHDKFVEEFEQTMQVVKRFVDSTNQHIPFLMRKADRADEYLQQSEEWPKVASGRSGEWRVASGELT